MNNVLDIIKSFVILWRAPIDSPAMKSIREESAKIGKSRKFENYVFGNIILGHKS